MTPQLESLAQAISENIWLSWLTILVGAFIAALIVKVILSFISHRLRKLTGHVRSNWDSISLDIVDGLRTWVLFTWGVFLFSRSVEQNETLQKLILIVVVLASTYQAALWGLHLIKNWKHTVLEARSGSDPSSSSAIGLLYTTVQAIFLVVMVLIALSNLGVNISALIAGLGVGGIAVALAAQNVLGDLLASLSIVLDKPFVVGDFIITGKELGTVQHIGVKTTRLRSLSGEELVVSNKDLLESRIQNFKRMQERRVVQNFRILYSTPQEKLAQVPGWVKAAIEKQPGLRFDRCHLAKYGESSLEFEFVFYVLDPDYTRYMDLQQIVLLDIFKTFADEQIQFAHPSRSIYVENWPR